MWGGVEMPGACPPRGERRRIRQSEGVRDNIDASGPGHGARTARMYAPNWYQMQAKRVIRGRRVVSIIGATGLVGSEIARILRSRRFPLSELRLFASGRRAERMARIGDRDLPVRAFALEAVAGSDICFLAVDGAFSKRYALKIASLGPIVIDNSSAFRMEPGVPLVVPEVNPEDIERHRGIIANPNCSTIQMVVALAPLHRRWRLRKVVVSTYQSVSGAGLAAAGELACQTVAELRGERASAREFPHRVAFNLLPQIGAFGPDGFALEESKLMNETKKILGDGTIDVVATAVRVPVFRGHSEAVYAEFDAPISLEEAREILAGSPGVEVMDDPARGIYPMPSAAAGKDATYVGRLRGDPGCPKALCMWVVSDNLRKGAALNAVQIAENLGRAS
jgi:aspartate-semialdehyde dehydrogenase